MRGAFLQLAAALVAASLAPSSWAAFELTYQIRNAAGQFNANHLQILNEALGHAERAWETVLTGYALPADLPPLVVNIWPINSGLAAGSYNSLTTQGGHTFAAGGDIYVNPDQIDAFANWQGPGANGLNYIDEVLAHETGHVLGVGTLWTANGVYAPGSFQYTGAFGLAAYRAEFDPAAAFVPVESAGDDGTMGSHWNQRMRSSVQEGTPPPADPYLLDPRVGIVDPFGRDMGLELMTGAIDADYGEPFMSRLTVESMRDLGYTTARFEDADGDGDVDGADRAKWSANFGATGLAIDSFAFGDADRDRGVYRRDFLLWQTAAGNGALLAAAVPEPTALALAALAAFSLCRRRRQTTNRVINSGDE